jgi:hypothetical protein
MLRSNVQREFSRVPEVSAKMKWRRIRYAVAIPAVAAVMPGCTGQPPGLLEQPASALGATFGVKVGEPFTFGGILILNASNESVTLDSVTPIDATPGFRVVGELARPADDAHDHLGGSDSYPPAAVDIPQLPGIKPLRSFIVRPKSKPLAGAQLLIGLEATRRTPVTARGFTVRYHDRFGNQYSLIEPYAVVICRPDPAPCPEGPLPAGM